jgi:bla regulator protein blaR1
MMRMIPTFFSSIGTLVGPAAANHVWQSTVFLAAAWLLTLALRKNQARVRYWLWLIASLKFLIPFALLIALGSSLSRPGNAAIAQSGFYSAVEEISLPFTPTVAPIVLPVSHTPHFAFLSLLPEFLLAAWLLGFAAVLSLWVLRWRRISAAMRNALPMSHGREVDALRQLERIARIRKPIPFLLSRDSLEPGIFGNFHPVLLWPSGFSERLDDAHLKAILAHEVWHVRRRDNLTAAIHMIVEAVFWFYPLVWWVGTRLVEERERACDEEVLRLGNQAQTYAEGILKTCEFCVGSPLACVSGVTGADLKQRILRIMSGHVARKLNFSRKLLLTAAGLMAVGVPIVFGMVNVPLNAQSATGQASRGVPEWQTAAGDRMAFDVVSIRQSKPDAPMTATFPLDPGDSYSPNGGLFSARFPLIAYIEFAYKLSLTPGQRQSVLAHLPQWVATENFEIHARASGNPTKDQMRLMMQSLLADRFKLAIHFETQQVPVLALTLIKPGKLGPKLRPHADGPPCDTSTPPANGSSANVTDVYPRECSVYGLLRRPGQMLLAGSRNTTMALLAASLPSFPGGASRPVVDQTGLSGRYDFTIQWTPESNGPTPSVADVQADPQATTFLEALKEQLGLKLESTKAPVDVLVIDHVEKPSPN